MPGHNAPNWIKVTDQAGWRPRDSQGELVYKNRMWIFGGWFGNYEACPRDVWNTSDGKSWTLVEETAPWKHGDLPMTVVFQDKIWFMGGWYNGLLPGRSASNEVWWSTDGTQWQQATQKAGWTPRLAAGAVVFKDRMWILGGSEDYFSKKQGHLKNDVWCSANGKEWELVTTNAGWSPRAFHQALVFGDRIWVLGGGNRYPEAPAGSTTSGARRMVPTGPGRHRQRLGKRVRGSHRLSTETGCGCLEVSRTHRSRATS